jgi:hypothetical protein
VAGNGSTENHFQLIWDFAKENLTMEEIKDTLLFATNCEENTAMQFDRKWGKQDLLLRICDWIGDNITKEDKKYGISHRL